MFFENYYVCYSDDIVINSISTYKTIMNKFILKFISNCKKNNVNLKANHTDKTNTDTKVYKLALIYSKYYLYWKIYGCVYDNDIMNILYDVEFIKIFSSDDA